MRIGLLFLMVLGWIGCQENQPASVQNVSPKDLYTTRCAACHGLDGKLELGGAKPLHTSVLTAEDVLLQIKNGKGSMPPFQGRLSEEEIHQLAQFVLKLRTP